MALSRPLVNPGTLCDPLPGDGDVLLVAARSHLQTIMVRLRSVICDQYLSQRYFSSEKEKIEFSKEAMQ